MYAADEARHDGGSRSCFEVARLNGGALSVDYDRRMLVECGMMAHLMCESQCTVPYCLLPYDNPHGQVVRWRFKLSDQAPGSALLSQASHLACWL